MKNSLIIIISVFLSTMAIAQKEINTEFATRWILLFRHSKKTEYLLAYSKTKLLILKNLKCKKTLFNNKKTCKLHFFFFYIYNKSYNYEKLNFNFSCNTYLKLLRQRRRQNTSWATPSSNSLQQPLREPTPQAAS